MNRQDAFRKMSEAVQEGDTETLIGEIEQTIDQTGVVELVQEAMMSGRRKIGEQFSSRACYLPEMIMAAESFQQGMKLIEPRLLESGTRAQSAGTMVIGTVMTDIHELGKNVVITLMKTHGFNVIDLGPNVSRTTFVEEAQKAAAPSIRSGRGRSAPMEPASRPPAPWSSPRG